MNSNPINSSAEFYTSALGKVNAQIIGNSCAAINLEALEKYGQFRSAIFMGIGDGSLLEQIGPRFKELIVLEASDRLIDDGQRRFASLAGLKLINSLFEDYEPLQGRKVSCILGNHVLEHLNDPIQVLRKTIDWLDADGVAVFTVPNACSLHRRIGVQLGILKGVNDLSEQDRVVGHTRVYDADTLHSHITAAGYNIVEAGGFNLKLVSQGQMTSWSESLHEAIYHVSRECPAEICSNLYAVCRIR